jgi:type I restriction enzyme, R subunit
VKDQFNYKKVKLSELVNIINNRFGTDFNYADQLFFDQMIEAASHFEELKQAAKVNSSDKFALLFNRLLSTLFIERMDQNEAIFARYMNDSAFQRVVCDWMRLEVYHRLKTNSD